MKLFIDCHAHLNIPNATKAAMQEIIRRAIRKQVNYIVGVIGDPDKFHHYQIQSEFTNVIHVIGIQRGQAMNDHTLMLSKLRKEIEGKRPHAIGEIGLEYTDQDNSFLRKKQQKLFRKQIQLAHEFDLPIVVHAGYGTDKDLVALLTDERADDLRGQIHCCRNGIDAIKEILNLGFFLSFGYPHTTNIQLAQSVRVTPVDRIHTETDSPYGLVGDPPRAKLLPGSVVEITKKLAEMKDMDPAEFAPRVLQNAKNLFKF
ncbi:MAG: TatD family hydrolase [Candidatus Hodarchaeales archaeon]|jgi:TatD DNase family protein